MAESRIAELVEKQSEADLRASIVITTYRRPEMLAELLEALHSQIAERPVEVIVVDNCPDASARQEIEGRKDTALRYIHERRSGVVHARNRAVAAAQGEYVIMLDDDEVPAAGWLDAWLNQADGDTDASFGRIVHRPLGPCPPDLASQVARNYSRDLRSPTGRDISDRWAYLGTGNAMFHRTRCLGPGDVFDVRFNSRGGEDVWLIRSLVKNGRRLLWNDAALVEELVSPDRMTLPALRLRRFNQGQLRCILMFGEGGIASLARVSPWMLVGLVQYAGYSVAAFAAGLVARDRRAHFLCEAGGGAGKMLWWQKARLLAYASD